jgi:nitroreductase
MDPDRCLPVQPGLLPTSGQIGYLLQTRRSIRVYKEKPVDPGTLQKIIEMAARAPSAHNARKVKWMVFSGRERLRRLAATTVDWMRWALEVMPERAAELNFGRRVQQWEAGLDGILRGAPALVVVHGEKEAGLPPGVTTGMDHQAPPLDYAISLSHLELGAMGLGLGTCWAGYVYKAANLYPPMHAALDLPEGHQCYGAMMVGYPGVAFWRIPQRSAPEIIWRL